MGGTANTVPFGEAPGAVIKACDFIRTRVYQALGILEDFNEVLRWSVTSLLYICILILNHSCAYMERQRMAV